MAIVTTPRNASSDSLTNTSPDSPVNGTAGTYAKANHTMRSWLQTPVNTVKKGKPALAVIHPIFEQCAKICDDTVWKELFTAASKGKLPNGFGFKEGIISFKRRNKVDVLDIGDDLPSIIEGIDQIKQFFAAHAGITSTKERIMSDEQDSISPDNGTISGRNTTQKPIKINIKTPVTANGENQGISPVLAALDENIYDLSDEDDSSTYVEAQRDILIWDKLKPKFQRVHLLGYVREYCKKHKLDRIHKDYGIAILNEAKVLQLLSGDNVIMDEYNIIEIKGFAYNHRLGRLEFDLLKNVDDFPVRKPSKSKAKGNQVTLLKVWEKYLSTYMAKDEITGLSVSQKPRSITTLRIVRTNTSTK